MRFPRRPRLLEGATVGGFILRMIFTVVALLGTYAVGFGFYVLWLGMFWYPKVFLGIGGGLLVITVGALISYKFDPKDSSSVETTRGY